MTNTRLAVWLIVIALANSAAADAVSLHYSFSKSKSGGLAIVTLDPSSGKILSQRIEFESEHCRFPKKVRPVGDGGTVLVTNDSKVEPYLFVIDTKNPRLSRLVELKTQPDELRVAGDLAILTGAEDWITTVDINGRAVLGSWDSTNMTVPRWNGPEDIFVTPNNRLAIVSFQKDGEKGKRKGGRLIVFQLPGMALMSDVMLARDYEKWNLKNKIRKLGPGPELIFVDEPSDTVLATLDNYGAVAFLKWSELKKGKLSTLTYVPTSGDSTWGTAFPDRGCIFQQKEKTLALICNAGPKGGAVLLNVLTQELESYFHTPPGIETPCYIAELSKLFAVCPGKTKQRKGDVVKKTFSPRKELYVFDLRKRPWVQVIGQERFLFQMGKIDRKGTTPWFVISAGQEANKADTILVFDPQTLTFVDQQKAVGKVGQFAHQ